MKQNNRLVANIAATFSTSDIGRSLYQLIALVSYVKGSLFMYLLPQVDTDNRIVCYSNDFLPGLVPYGQNNQMCPRSLSINQIIAVRAKYIFFYNRCVCITMDIIIIIIIIIMAGITVV